MLTAKAIKDNIKRLSYDVSIGLEDDSITFTHLDIEVSRQFMDNPSNEIKEAFDIFMEKYISRFEKKPSLSAHNYAMAMNKINEIEEACRYKEFIKDNIHTRLDYKSIVKDLDIKTKKYRRSVCEDLIQATINLVSNNDNQYILKIDMKPNLKSSFTDREVIPRIESFCEMITKLDKLVD